MVHLLKKYFYNRFLINIFSRYISHGSIIPEHRFELSLMHCLHRGDTEKSTCLLRHITTEKSDLCQYAVCITGKTMLKK